MMHVIFNQVRAESINFFIDLCAEGVLLNNPVAYHMMALMLISNRNENDSSIVKHEKIKTARECLITKKPSIISRNQLNKD